MGACMTQLLGRCQHTMAHDAADLQPEAAVWCTWQTVDIHT